MRDDLESYADESRAATKRPVIRSDVPEPTRWFFRCTAMMMAALLIPAAVQAPFDIEPDIVRPDDATIIMALSLSAAIVVAVVLVATLVRGGRHGSSE